MKFSKLTLVGALCAAGMLTSGIAQAADTATVAVSATVKGTCKFTTAAGSLAFGDLDPVLHPNVNVTASTQPVFWCTNNASYTITDDDGLYETGVGARRMKHASLAEYIPYTMTYTASGTGTGPLTPITMDIAGSITGTDYQSSSDGVFGDTVILSITP